MKQFSFATLSTFCAILVIGFGLFVHDAFAELVPPLTVLIYTHTNDPNVRNAYINSYNEFQSVGATVIYRDITGMSDQAFSAQLRADMTAGQNLFIYGGHGSLTDLSTDGVGFNRAFAMREASNIAAEKGGEVTGVVESCGSGNVCQISNLAGEGNLDGVFTASLPGDYGYVFSQGGPWFAQFGEQFKNSLSHFGDGTSRDPDVNHDGVLTQGELANALYGPNVSMRAQIPDPDKPFAFKDAATAAKYQKYTDCIVMRPGQVDQSYSPNSSKSGDVTTEFKPTSISGYENRTKDPGAFPVLGQVRDEQSDESQINFDLRRLGSDFIETEVTRALSSQTQTAGITKKIILLPTKAQAEEFVKSLGGNSSGQGSYTINGMKVKAGVHYLSNHPNPVDKITFDNDCNPRQWAQPSFSPPPQTTNGNGNANNQGGGNQGGTGTGGGLNALLQALMQGLLGGGQGNNGNQSGQGGNAGNGNGTIPCSAYGVSPVCGSDGKTYTNSCYLQQYGATEVHPGVCATTSPTPTPTPKPTPDITNLVALLQKSGLSQSVIDQIMKSLSTIFSSSPNGNTMIQ